MKTKEECVSNIISERHSGKSFSSKEVPQEVLKKLVQAARFSPSCYNDQPWVYLITSQKETPDSFYKLAECLVPGNKEWAIKAPILILVCADTLFTKNQKLNRWGLYDTGASAMSFVLEATSLKLMAHQMGGFDENKARQTFSIPDQYIPMSVMALGYEEKNEISKEKDRKPVEENFYLGDWGHPISFSN